MALIFLASQDTKDSIGEPFLTTISEIYSDFLDNRDIEVELDCVYKSDMQKLNLETRNINEPTDVLSYPIFLNKTELLSHPVQNSLLIGTIVMCPEKAIEYGETLPQLVHHGLLHLCGYDHEVDMESWQAQERSILTNFKKAGLIIPGVPHESL